MVEKVLSHREWLELFLIKNCNSIIFNFNYVIVSRGTERILINQVTEQKSETERIRM